MVLSNSFKSLLFLSVLFCSSCLSWQNSTNSQNSVSPLETFQTKSEIHFPTKEPETFQADLIIKNEGEDEKISLARSGERFLLKTDGSAKLQTEQNKSFLINFAKKIYTENEIKISPIGGVSGETLDDFLTTEWLSQKTDAKIEKLEDENGLAKYKAVFENSEVFIFVEPTLEIPVREEFYSIDGDSKKLVYSMELRNIKLAVEENLFEIPKDFRRVSIDEFRVNLKHDE